MFLAALFFALRPFYALYLATLTPPILRQLTLPVCQIIIEPLDESVPTSSIDLIEVSLEEAVERGIDFIDVPL